jgi:uncharacterized SAM-binding protein YcdF (DUF218 family)
MFFIFSKILNFIITPVVWIFTLLLFAVFSKNQKIKRKTLLATLIIFTLLSNPFIFNEAMRQWEIPMTRNEDLQKYDAAIVLGGLLFHSEEYNRTQYKRGIDRLLQAVELYKKGIVKKIFFVGGSGDIRLEDMKEGIYVKEFLLTIGIPEADILIESESKNTRENALFAKPILDEHLPNARLLLVTSGFHMRRAMACFEKVGIKTEPYSTDIMSGDRYFDIGFLVPDVNALKSWNELIHEVVGYVVYKISGYL